MKKKISLALSLIMITLALFGCGLIEHDYEKDYAQKIATIKSITQEVPVTYDIYDEYGEISGSRIEEYPFTSPKVDIYKSTLVNYVNSYAQTYLSQEGYTVDKLVNEVLGMLIDYELLLIETDKLFYVDLMHWTMDEVDELQRKVYQTIDQELFDITNTILSDRGKPVLTKSEEEAAAETTYPVQPASQEEDVEAKRYQEYQAGTATYDANRRVWSFDSWYLDDEWYIEDESKYLTAYPGMYGTEDEKSLARDAMNSYLQVIYQRAELLIGVTSAQQKIIDQEIKELKNIQKTKGPEYVYPTLGRRLLIKFLIGDTLIKSKKMDKLEQYVSKDLVTVTGDEVLTKYNIKLDEQTKLFTDSPASYNQAVDNGDLILYTPTDRFVFVKHILLKFSDEQQAKHDAIAEEEGIDITDATVGNRESYEKRRDALADEIVVYEHVNGEDDLSNPKSAQSVYNEIKAEMAKYKNNAKYAERAFDTLIYKYNMDPGMFNSMTYGYSLSYEYEEGESWAIEFAAAARDFRTNPIYKVGHIYEQRVVTSFGIHIMYYAADPKKYEVKYIDSYITAGANQTVYDVIKQQLLSERQSAAYNEWSQTYIDNNKENYAVIEDKLVDRYIKDLKKQ